MRKAMTIVAMMLAAAALMQANIKFDGALVVQVSGDGPVKLLVAEVQPDLAMRATAISSMRRGMSGSGPIRTSS